MHQLRNLILDGRIKKAIFMLNNQQFTQQDLLKQDAEDNTALHWSIKIQNEALILALLENGARICQNRVNKQGHTPLQLAIKLKLSTNIIKALQPKNYAPANDHHHSDFRAHEIFA